MKSKFINLLFIAVLIITVCPLSAGAIDAVELSAAFGRIHDCEVEAATTVAIDSLVISIHDLRLELESGRLAFVEPLVIDSVTRVYGGYFEGEGRLLFNPRVPTERDQLKRFFETDSLNRYFNKIFMFFSDDIYQQIVASSPPSKTLFGRDEIGRAVNEREWLGKFAHLDFCFNVLKNLTQTPDETYLLVNVDCDKTQRVFFEFNPDAREEVSLWRLYREAFEDRAERVCSYSQAADENFNNLNGRSKARIEIGHYDIEAAIDQKGVYSGVTDISFEVLQPVQLLRLGLHNLLRVDSVKCSRGDPVAAFRYQDKSLWSDWHSGLYLFFDRPFVPGDSAVLTFYCEGEIAQREMGQFYVTAGARWYPRYSDNPRTTFEMNFKTPKKYQFAATGTLVESETVKDTLFTHWRVEQPAKNVSFSIGVMRKYLFPDPDTGHVEIYYSKDLHEEIGRAYDELMVLSSKLDGKQEDFIFLTGKHMEKQVSEDVINSMKVFSRQFGSYAFDRIRVSEILANHGEAFPGFLHMGLATWNNTDPWGNERLFRAHEVAHQWWGIGVGYETYHDQWLSEGFAEYSALLYIQSILGGKKFLEKIEDYRKDIFSVRKYIFGLSGEEAGPIIMGYRTASTKTEGDYGLIIYKKGALVLHMLRNMMIDSGP